MKIETIKFGELHVDAKDILNFPEGILGFEHLKKFFVVDPGDNTLILWLQSVTDENVAFPIIEPSMFDPNYTIRLLPAEMNSLQMSELKEARVYSILTIPSDVSKMSANMKAPIVINSKNNLARQIVLQDNKLPLRLEIYKELKKRIVSYNYDDSNSVHEKVNSNQRSISTETDTEREHSLQDEIKRSETTSLI